MIRSFPFKLRRRTGGLQLGLLWAGSWLAACDPSEHQQRTDHSPVVVVPPETAHLEAPVQHANPTSILLSLQQDLARVPLTGQADHDFTQLVLTYTHAGLDLANLAVEYSTAASARTAARQARASQEQRLVEVTSLASHLPPLPSPRPAAAARPFGLVAATLRAELDSARVQRPVRSAPVRDLALAWQAYERGITLLARLELREGKDARLRAVARQLLQLKPVVFADSVTY